MTTSQTAAARQAADDNTIAQAHRAWIEVDPERARMLAAVLRYRSAWRELAEALEDCDRRLLWQQWGFACFDAYCAEELRLPKALMTRYRNALAFLREAGSTGTEVPLQSVEVARQALAAGEAGEIPADEAGEIVTKALEGSEGPRQLAHELHEARQRAFEPRLFGRGPDPAALAKARKVWARVEVATQPLREQMPSRVVDALEVVTAYLKDPSSSPQAAGAGETAGENPADDEPIPYLPASSDDTDDKYLALAMPSGQPDPVPSQLEESSEQAPAAHPADEHRAYDAEDASNAEATPQGQELVRRCEELLWLHPRADAAAAQPLRSALSRQLAQLSEADRKALQSALGAARWQTLTSILGIDEPSMDAVEERTVVYDE